MDNTQKNLLPAKSILANLMAMEGLTVEQCDVPTASFNTLTRVLQIPTLDSSLSPELFDLFIGHEVGHALWTKSEDLLRGKALGLSASILNVVEDARIERRIKNKYPGIRSSFAKGYKKLVDENFFGTKDIDINELNFADRINLLLKSGTKSGTKTTHIKFSDEETVLLEKVETTENFDDVMRVTREVMDYMKIEKEVKGYNKMGPSIGESLEDEDTDDGQQTIGQYPDSDSENESEDGSGNPDSQYPDSDSENESGDGSENESGDGSGNEAGGKNKPDGEDENPDKLEAHTDDAFKRNEKKLFSTNNTQLYYANIPDIDLSKAIVPFKQLWNRNKDWVTKLGSTADNSTVAEQLNQQSFLVAEQLNQQSFLLKELQSVCQEGNKVAAYLAKAFELRKNAEQLKRVKIARTGEVDVTKLYSYKFNDDLFKKLSIIPGGKSHGLVILVDWSGSMRGVMHETIKQLINLVLFCKKVNIPHEVYAFSSGYDLPYVPTPVIGDLKVGEFRLLNLLSSKMSAADFNYAASYLLLYGEMFSGTSRARPRGFYQPTWFNLNSTPLDQSIITAMKLLPEFQQQYKLQIVNLVVLSDGEGDRFGDHVWSIPAAGSPEAERGELACNRARDRERPSVMVLRDPITKNQLRVNGSNHAALMHLLKLRTGCKSAGFYVTPLKRLTKTICDFFPGAMNNNEILKNLKKAFRSDKYLVTTSIGYDEYYLLNVEGSTQAPLDVTRNTLKGLVSAFTTYTTRKLLHRTLLDRFIKLIA